MLFAKNDPNNDIDRAPGASWISGTQSVGVYGIIDSCSANAIANGAQYGSKQT
jgi:hypothetical protein